MCWICGDTYGYPNGHSWLSATCLTPKTCSICGEMTGAAIGHNWENATCTDAKNCKNCGTTEGDPAGHNYLSTTHICAICFQEDPKMEQYRAYAALCDKAIAEVKLEGPLYYGSSADFEYDQASILSDIKPIKRKLMALEGDNSISANAKRKELTAELTRLEAELEDLYARRSRQLRIAAAEAEKKSFYEQLFG